MIVVLAVVVMGTQLPGDLSFARLAPASLAVSALWIGGLLLANRAGRGPAVATPLPEVGTGVTSTRLGDYHLAVRDLFGGNTFQPALFLLAAVISGDPVLPAAQHTDIYLTALGVVLITSVYVAGLVFRPWRPYLRMGVDSLAVLLLSAAGIAGLATIGA